MTKAIKTVPTNITLPGKVLENIELRFVEPLKAEEFFGRPSRSMVIRALLEIALENGALFRPENARDYESFKVEMRRILKDRTEV